MPSLTVNAGSGSGRLFSAANTWANTRAGTGVIQGVDGQAKVLSEKQTPGGSGEIHEIDRCFFNFDTSSLPDNAIIGTVQLKLFVNAITRNGMGTYGFYIVSSLQANPASLAFTDWNNVGSSDLGGGRKDETSTGLKTYTVDSSLVSSTGYTKIALRPNRDITNVPPEDDNDREEWRFDAYNGSTPPQLVVNYTVPGMFLAFL